eukprot:359589-Chlamydomonas_euryale.AAC.1
MTAMMTARSSPAARPLPAAFNAAAAGNRDAAEADALSLYQVAAGAAGGAVEAAGGARRMSTASARWPNGPPSYPCACA